MPEISTTWRPRGPLDLRLTLGPQRRGAGDPTFQTDAAGALWRTARTPLGPATYTLRRTSDGVVAMTAWGDGAEWAVAGLPDLLGARDDTADRFAPRHALLRETAARHPGLRISRNGLVFETLVPSVLEQKVVGADARRSWRLLVRRYGDPAPGPAPAGMVVCPPPAVWARIPSWEWHRANVDGKRSRAILRAAAVAARLEESVGMSGDDVHRRLRAVEGIGAWTAAEIAQRAHGDVDAVSVGDFHLAAFVGWALAGRPVDDAGMLELLAPYRPFRYRAIRLLEVSGFRKPRFGPRMSRQDIRAL